MSVVRTARLAIRPRTSMRRGGLRALKPAPFAAAEEPREQLEYQEYRESRQ